MAYELRHNAVVFSKDTTCSSLEEELEMPWIGLLVADIGFERNIGNEILSKLNNKHWYENFL